MAQTPDETMNTSRRASGARRLFMRRTPRRDLLVFAALLALTWSIYKWSNGAMWAEQIALATAFCALIWMKEDTVAGRWLFIAVVATGTLAAILLSL